MPQKMRVAVLFGGRSGEHEVSLMSARSVLEALDPDRFEAVPVGIARDGRWITGPDPLAQLTAAVQTRDEQAGPAGRVLTWPGGEVERVLQGVDVVFPVLHGPNGEDGTVQGLLELANLPYVGGGVAASAVGMDKGLMKAVFAAAGLPQARYQVLLRSEWQRAKAEAAAAGGPAGGAFLDQIEAAFGYPCFVKPANLGSSVGVSKAHYRAELAQALDEAGRHDRRIVVEEFIDAREIECSVLGNDRPEASLPGEIVPSSEFYDYRAKYVDGKSGLIIPAELSPDAVREVQRLAVEAFRAIDCAGLARVDFFLQRGTGRVLINEINTIPGFTSISMYPKLWEASGLPYRELITRLIELALERYREKQPQ